MKPRRFWFYQTSLFNTPLRCGAPLFAGFAFMISGLGADAGDILRGGASPTRNNARSGANATGAPTPAATDAARANARDTLSRTTKTIQSIRAMQQAARKAAIKGPNNLGKNPNNPAIQMPNVPNGLGTNGLRVSSSLNTDPTKWTGAELPKQTIKKGKTEVTIKQTEQQALLHWDTFNVGKKTTLTFDQSKGGADVGKWIAFNQVTDPSTNPSQILGNIKADGQVYLINPNGVIFGGSSTVNARNLTVSSLPINTNLIERGLLNNPDAQFLFSGIDIPAGVNGTPAFTPEKPLAPSGRYGDVIVEKGATLRSPTNSAKVGGRISLVGPNVSNNGSILTPDGQAILAAGLQVGFSAHSASDPSLRGLDTYIGVVSSSSGDDYAGKVLNQGLIEAVRGSIGLSGSHIRQLSLLSSTTSVALNGRIDINASFDSVPNPNPSSFSARPFISREAGIIELGDHSSLFVIPEYDSNESAPRNELPLKSQVNLTGEIIHFGKNSTVLAPNGLVSAAAGEWKLLGTGASTVTRFARTKGQVYVDKGALIDVSGSLNVEVPVSQNIIAVDLRGAELADSPLQREGSLRGQTVYVDVRDSGIYQARHWQGTPLANVAGFANLIERKVDQLTVAGGSVTISAGSSVILQEGSKIDVSGGSTAFQGGMVATSRLITGGRLVDISTATPEIVYEGIYDGTFTVSNEKFSMSDTFLSALAPKGMRFEPGSIQGATGGKVNISAPSMAIDGQLDGKTITGDRQRSTAPERSSLSLSFTADDTTYPTLPVHSPKPPSITFRTNPKQKPVDPFALDQAGMPQALDSERIAEVQLSTTLLSEDNFGTLSINNPDGDIILESGQKIIAGDRAALEFTASNIQIDGTIRSAGGIMTFAANNLTLDAFNALSNSSAPSVPSPSDGRGRFILGASGIIDTSGRIVDDRPFSPSRSRMPLAIDGGSVSVSAFTASLLTGGLIDVSGGVRASESATLSYGAAGSISITSGRDLNLSAVSGGNLTLGATLLGLSGSSKAGGSLSLTALAFQIGGASAPSGFTLLDQAFFNNGGFSSFSIASSGLASQTPGQFLTGIVVDSSANIRPITKSLIADTSSESLLLRNITRPVGVRPHVSILISAKGESDPFANTLLGRGDIMVDDGARINAGPQGSLSFTADTVTILGNLTSNGGTINLAGASRFPTETPDLLLPTVLLGSSARLDVSGVTVLEPNALGLRQGSVLAGGVISASGNIVAETGSVIDVSGTRGTLDLPPSARSLKAAVNNTLNGKITTPVKISSNGGSINLRGSQMLYSDATLVGHAGGKSANGGSLSISSGRFIRQGEAFTSADANLVIRQTRLYIPQGFAGQGPGNILADPAGAPLEGIGFFSPDTIKGGGIESLVLGGNLRIDESVNIRVAGSVKLATAGVIYSSERLRVDAAYVQLGQDFQAPRLVTDPNVLFTRQDASGTTLPYQFAPTSGTGAIEIVSRHIDVGNFSGQGIGETSFNAKNGDVRGNGTLSLSGKLRIKAGQIHPTTAGNFDIFVYDSTGSGGVNLPGSIFINRGSNRPAPFSAAGSLGIYSSAISIKGRLVSPHGTINIGWSGGSSRPVDAIAGTAGQLGATKTVIFGSSARISVAGSKTSMGDPLSLPYGISFDGITWIDPSGAEITTEGPPPKKVTISSESIETKKGSRINISGGGDLFAYRWVAGNGGTTDILDSTSSFAVLPSYGADIAPYAPFNSNPSAVNLGGEDGYVNSSLRPGDKITIGAGGGLAAGTYTLLPARYALMKGAYLVTPVTGSPNGSQNLPDGSRLVEGYRSNDLNPVRTGRTQISRFEVASGKIVRQRAEYEKFSANDFFKEAALLRSIQTPRLPVDAGSLSFVSGNSLALKGIVNAKAQEEALGALIDISSSSDIIINRSGTTASKSTLAISTSLINSFGAESLLIGGTRQKAEGGTIVTVESGNITVNTGKKFVSGEDLIFAARDSISISANSEIRGEGGSTPVENLIIGDADDPGSGNGVLVRASGISGGQVARRAITDSASPSITVGAGARLAAGGLILDSTGISRINQSTRLKFESITLGSGRISIQLANPGSIKTSDSLVLAGKALDRINLATGLVTLNSYSSIDFYGSGTFGTNKLSNLTLQSAEIRGYNQAANRTVRLLSEKVTILGTSESIAAPSSPLAGSGNIVIEADSIGLGSGMSAIRGFDDVRMKANESILSLGSGSFQTIGSSLQLVTPVVSGLGNTNFAIKADKTLSLSRPAGKPSETPQAGLGASLSLSGSRVAINSNIDLPSGNVLLRASNGDVVIGNNASSTISVNGGTTRLIDRVIYTNAGSVRIESDTGDVEIDRLGKVTSSATVSGTRAGLVSISAPGGIFNITGLIQGLGSDAPSGGSFVLDSLAVQGNVLAPIDSALNVGGFSQLREFRVRQGNININGSPVAAVYRVSTDNGSLFVSGRIDASGTNGGTIDLKSSGSLRLLNGSILDASAKSFNSAGKGGSVTLEAGNQRFGSLDTAATLDIATGSLIRLGVSENNNGSAKLGKFTGTLHLRAQRNGSNTDVNIEPILGNIQGASAIRVEGVKLYGVSGTGTITSTIQNTIRADAQAFLGTGGSASVNYTSMRDRLIAGNPSLNLILMPGVEIYNLAGDVALGTSNSSASSDWNLSSWRFGPLGAPGVLTIRSSGNVTFFNALSDGFSGGSSLWLSPLNQNNPLLPDNSESWSYRIAAGADFSAASFRATASPESLGQALGNVSIGKNLGSATVNGGRNALTSSIMGNAFQVIRTGSGDIDIHSARSIQLLNPFASVYTAGTAVANPETLFSANDFNLPILSVVPPLPQNSLGAAQQTYPAQYSMAGGNVSLAAGVSIDRKTRNNSGLIDDSSRQVPTNWLYRRSYVDGNGRFGRVDISSGTRRVVDTDASTTWWVDFSNFFQAVGALGGGNIDIVSGGSVNNIDAAIPTNFRAPAGKPSAGRYIELGGGNLRIATATDLSGGVYYLERGNARFEIGGSLTTNATRSPSFGLVSNLNNPSANILDSRTWIPTLMFAGKARYEISTVGDALIGPVYNPFLLPTGLNNRFWYKTYFSTFGNQSGAAVFSLSGDITFRNAVNLPNSLSPQSILRTWLDTQNLLTNANNTTAWSQPWLRLGETSTTAFNTILNLSAPNLSLSALGGDIILGGSTVLSPAARGNLELLANGSISGLSETGLSNRIIPGQTTVLWSSSSINVSDTSQSLIPGINNPLNYFSIVGDAASANSSTTNIFMDSLNLALSESGSFTGSNSTIQVKQSRHDPGILHRGDTNPVTIYARGGDISGLTLFAPKTSRIVAGRDITDVAFYVQNLASSDITSVVAGRDIVSSNANSILRSLARSEGNQPASTENPLSGDIQISGPGTLEVLSGRNIDLGTVAGNPDGTGTGISSIGNFRNPFLPAKGADLVVTAGIGPASSLTSSHLDIPAFIDDFVETKAGRRHLKELGIRDFDSLSSEEQALAAMDVFLLVLRDTGRNFNDPESEEFRSYDTGFDAIKSLFPEDTTWFGEVLARSRDIRTRSGGNIGIFAPGGGLTLSDTAIGNPLAPPGIVTEGGGSVSIFTNDSVNIGIGRIFTLRGGNVVIWSSEGDIAAGTSSRTVQAAPPTRVIIDSQSAAVETDLAGVATGGGIGVLASVQGVEAGDVDLIAPTGTIDAGDAGIRVSGNINLAAVTVVNAANISAGGASTGTPVAASAPSVSAVTTASNTAAASTSAAPKPQDDTRQDDTSTESADTTPSVYTVTVIGYGGGGAPTDDEDESEEEAE